MQKLKGFTLIELLISIAVIGTISIITVQLMFNLLMVNSKQRALSSSSDDSYYILEKLESQITEATSINIPNDKEIEIRTKGLCINYRYDATNLLIEKAQDLSGTCSPVSYVSVTSDNLKITGFSLSPVGTHPGMVSVSYRGEYHDSLTTYEFEYKTNVFSRLSI